MEGHRNTTATVRAVLSACEKAGADTQALLDDVGIAQEIVNDIDGEIPIEQMRALWQAAYRMSRDPHLALHAAREAAPGAYKSVDYMLMNSPDLGAAVTRLVRYFRLINTWLGFALEDRPDGVTLVLSSDVGPMPPPAAEYAFAVLTARLRVGLGEEWAPRAVTFSHPPPPGPNAYEEFFRCPVGFSGHRPEYTIGREAWEKPIPGRDSALFRMAENYSDVLLETQHPPDDIVTRLRGEITEALKDGEPQRDVLARKMGLSGRTLHRRLADAGVTFVKLVETVQKDLALSCMQRNDLALSEIAFLVGFSDQSAFSRAFKRWTGTTPRQFRLSRARQDGSPGSAT